MTGPEHYTEAERLISDAVSWDSDHKQVAIDSVVAAVAQVHATLALAAAQARLAIAGSTSDSANEWRLAVHGAAS